MISSAANADTCAFSKTGRKIGCVQDASNCSLVDTWTRGQWQFAGQELDPKAIEGPPPEVAAKRVGRGVWNIVSWPKRRALGRVAASNAKQTRWRIRNTRGNVVATARGPDGAKIGMVILYFGADVFCEEIVYAVVGHALFARLPLGDAVETFIRREDAERFIEEVRGDDPELAAKLRIEVRELEAGGIN